MELVKTASVTRARMSNSFTRFSNGFFTPSHHVSRHGHSLVIVRDGVPFYVYFLKNFFKCRFLAQIPYEHRHKWLNEINIHKTPVEKFVITACVKLDIIDIPPLQYCVMKNLIRYKTRNSNEFIFGILPQKGEICFFLFFFNLLVFFWREISPMRCSIDLKKILCFFCVVCFACIFDGRDEVFSLQSQFPKTKAKSITTKSIIENKR